MAARRHGCHTAICVAAFVSVRPAMFYRRQTLRLYNCSARCWSCVPAPCARTHVTRVRPRNYSPVHTTATRTLNPVCCVSPIVGHRCRAAARTRTRTRTSIYRLVPVLVICKFVSRVSRRPPDVPVAHRNGQPASITRNRINRVRRRSASYYVYSCMSDPRDVRFDVRFCALSCPGPIEIPDAVASRHEQLRNRPMEAVRN